MSIQSLAHGCNWHFCFFAALAATGLIRAWLARCACQHEKAHEHVSAALIDFSIAVLSL